MATIVNRVRKQMNGLTKKLAYVTRNVKYNTMEWDDVLDHASADSGISRAQLAGAMDAFLKQVKQMLLNGHTLEMGDLFFLRLGSSAKSVENKEDVSADLIKRMRILVLPSTELKQQIQRIKYETVIVEDDEEPEP